MPDSGRKGKWLKAAIALEKRSSNKKHVLIDRYVMAAKAAADTAKDIGMIFPGLNRCQTYRRLIITEKSPKPLLVARTINGKCELNPRVRASAAMPTAVGAIHFFRSLLSIRPTSETGNRQSGNSRDCSIVLRLTASFKWPHGAISSL